MSNPPDRQSTPTIREFVERRIDGRLEGLRVSLPARVLAYDAERHRLNAQPLVHQAHIEEGGTRVVKRLPVVTDVPIVWPGRVTFPIAVGDIVLLSFASSSIARVKLSGKEGDPGDDRHHRLSDAVAIPGLSIGTPGFDATANAYVVHYGDVRFGGPGAAQQLTRSSDVETALKGALSDPSVAAAILGVSLPGGAAALVVAVNAYFLAHPVGGSPNVKAE